MRCGKRWTSSLSCFLCALASWRLIFRSIVLALESRPATIHPTMTENEIAKIIVGAAIEVHRTLGGPGLLESVYEEALVFELQQRGLKAEKQVPVPIPYKGITLATPLRLDLRVEGLVLVENKATTEYHSLYEVQLLTYLRLTGLKLGLVINFGERYAKDGIHRVVNDL